MYQLRNLVNRRNVVGDVSKNMNASEEFLDLIATAHIAAASLDVLKVKDSATAFTDIPNSKLSEALDSVVENVVEMYVNVSFSAKKVQVNAKNMQDNIQEYAKETLSLGLLVWSLKMQLEKVMVCVSFAVGSISSLFSCYRPHQLLY